MTTPFDRDTHDAHDDFTLPAIHAHELVELVQRWRVEPAVLLAGTALREEMLADPALRLPLATVVKLIERARALTGEPGLGLYMGLRMRVSSHGYLGFAAMTAATLREALEVTARYARTRTDALELRFHVAGDLASLVIEERAPLGSARDVIVFALTVGLWQIGMALTGEPLHGGMDLAFPEPAYFERFRHLAPGGIRFGQPAHRMTFATTLLDLPVKMADPAAFRLVQAQCERLLDALGYPERLGARVRQLLGINAEAGFLSLEETASELGMSARTLKRKLAADGTSFSEILDEERRERAVLLLRGTQLGLDEVAERLGYSDLANFTRAFRRWTGVPPGAFRAAPGGSGRSERRRRP